MIAAGTQRPTSASQATAGKMYNWTSAGNGRKTSKPAKKAVAILRRDTGRSAAITAAAT